MWDARSNSTTTCYCSARHSMRTVWYMILHCWRTERLSASERRVRYGRVGRVRQTNFDTSSFLRIAEMPEVEGDDPPSGEKRARRRARRAANRPPSPMPGGR